MLRSLGITLSVLLLLGAAIGFSYKKGYQDGGNDGVYIALDTIKNICEDQLKSDTSVTEIVLINPDTNIYILSRKTLLKEEED